MKLIKTNRMVDGLEVQVYNPSTNRMIGKDEIIDLDVIPNYHDRYALFQMMREGDLEELKELQEVVADKPTKKGTATQDTNAQDKE